MHDSMTLEIAGLGIIFYSPSAATMIAEGEDYLTTHYTTEEQVQLHIQKGTLVGFGTCSPGRYILRFHHGYPRDDELHAARYKLRLGVNCTNNVVYFRDLFDLLDWYADCPQKQQLSLPSGIYHVTLVSDRPPSGILGDNQIIDIYFNRLPAFPPLAKEGIPTLCLETR
jgi:hypothetical protein